MSLFGFSGLDLVSLLLVLILFAINGWLALAVLLAALIYSHWIDLVALGAALTIPVVVGIGLLMVVAAFGVFLHLVERIARLLGWGAGGKTLITVLLGPPLGLALLCLLLRG
jgi:hypothetical protein